MWTQRVVLAVARRLVPFVAIAVLVALAPGAPLAEVGTLDSNADFKLLAANGWERVVNGPGPLVPGPGSHLASYAWSMAWFNGALYVGTGHFEGDGSLASLANQRAEIWRYTPGGAGGAEGTWQRVFQSPTGLLGIPRELGYRWMTVCDAPAGGTPTLYISTMGPQQGNILRTTNGTNFTLVSRTGLPAGTVGFRTMVCYTEASGQKVLVTAPVGRGGQPFDSDAVDPANSIALVNENPGGTGTWRNYSPVHIDGDVDNNSLFTIYASSSTPSTLYAGVSNQVDGVRVYKTTGCPSTTNCVPAWTKVIDNGGGRSKRAPDLARNVGISDMMEHNGYIYMGVSTSAGDRVTAELWRLKMVDHTWELLIGEERLNLNPDLTPVFSPVSKFVCPLGLQTIDAVGAANDCPPTALRGAGYGAKAATPAGPFPDGNQFYFWRLLHYKNDPVTTPQGDNRLYMGTLEGFSGGGGGGGGGVSGFDILRTADGVTWSNNTPSCAGPGCVTNNSLGAFDVGSGMRTIAASPIGLFIGSANNPQGSREPGEVGGCAVWLGTCDPALASPPVADARVSLKSSRPGQVVFNSQLQRFIAYDDETPPNGRVSVTLNGSGSGDPFCGDIVSYQWAIGNQTGANCAALPNSLGAPSASSTLALPTPLCTSAANPDCAMYSAGVAAGTGYADYTFTLKVVDNAGNPSCQAMVVRASANLPPNVTAFTNPPAVSSQGRLSVNLVDSDGNLSETLTLQGMCVDPEGQSLTCTWSSSPAGVTGLPSADADPASLGTTYTATVPIGDTQGGGTRWSIILTGIDNLGNQTALEIAVRVRGTTDDPGENDRPVCEGTTRTIPANTPLVINPAAEGLCFDPENGSISYPTANIQQPSGQPNSVVGGANLTYTPPPGFSGTVVFGFQGCDTDAACSDSAGVRVNVLPPPVTANDFNGDKKADILWRHTSGPVYLWLMDGTTITPGSNFAGSAGNDWIIQGVGDFNGDGKADILWRHTSGLVYIWLMNGTGIVGTGSPGGPDNTWTIEGVGDFDGDGKADILWRHASSLVYIWLMNGTAINGSGSPGSVPANWTFQGIGDFNGGGMADVLWRDAANVTHVWLMNGTAITTNGSPGSVAANWTIQRVNDFNGDGKADVLWRDSAGVVHIWIMNGAAINIPASGSPGGADPSEWAIQ